MYVASSPNDFPSHVWITADTYGLVGYFAACDVLVRPVNTGALLSLRRPVEIIASTDFFQTIENRLEDDNTPSFFTRKIHWLPLHSSFGQALVFDDPQEVFKLMPGVADVNPDDFLDIDNATVDELLAVDPMLLAPELVDRFTERLRAEGLLDDDDIGCGIEVDDARIWSLSKELDHGRLPTVAELAEAENNQDIADMLTSKILTTPALPAIVQEPKIKELLERWREAIKAGDAVLAKRHIAMTRYHELLGANGCTALVVTSDMTVSLVHWVGVLTDARIGRRVRLDACLRLIYSIHFDVPKESFKNCTIVHPNTGAAMRKMKGRFRQPLSHEMIRLRAMWQRMIDGPGVEAVWGLYVL